MIKLSVSEACNKCSLFSPTCAKTIAGSGIDFDISCLWQNSCSILKKPKDFTDVILYKTGFKIDAFTCSISDKLDDLSGLKENEALHSYYKHYIVVDDKFRKDNLYPIKVFDKIVGHVKTDVDDVIVDIFINVKCALVPYRQGVSSILHKEFVGCRLVL